MAGKVINFVKTTSSKLAEEVRNQLGDQFPGAIIHVHDSNGDENLYIGSDKITDKFNLGSNLSNTPIQQIGGIDVSTIGDLAEKSISQIIIDIVTPSGKPLDPRLVVESTDDLLTIDNPYQGMVVNVKGSSTLWVLTGTEPTDPESWSEVISSQEGTEEELDEILERLGVAETDISDIKSQLGIMSSSISSVQEGIDSIATDLSTLDSRVSVVEDSVVSIASDLDGVKSDVSQLQSDVTNITSSVDLLSLRIDDVEVSVATIASNVSVLDSRVSDVEVSISTIASDISQVQDDITVISSNLTDISTGLNELSSVVGAREEGEESTGIFGELDKLNKKVEGAALGEYTYPVMSEDMATRATEAGIGFDKETDPYILIENDFHPTESQGDIYLEKIYEMNKAIRILAAEVARLRNSFDYGIDSYTNTRTAKSTQLAEMNVDEDEPLWAIDPGYLSLVPDSSPNFVTVLDVNNNFIPYGNCEIDYSVEGQLTFNNGFARFYDGGDEEAWGLENWNNDKNDKLTLYKLKDAQLINYLVTDKPDIKITLVSQDEERTEREIDFSQILRGTTVRKYGFCIIVSRKVDLKVDNEDVERGFNYIYISIINYENDEKLLEGYLTNDNRLVSSRVEVPKRYSIKSIEFDRLTLSRMKFYTKFEDFGEEVIPSAPSEQDYKYEVAHIAIRSVTTSEMLNSVADHLRDNELIWNKETKTLHIKSDGKIYAIGSNKEDDKETDDNMTDRQIIEALNKMGIVVNVEYKKDSQGQDTEEIESLSNISLAPISDVTFINEDTDKKFTFTVDPEGNLVGKEKPIETIKSFLSGLGFSDADYDAIENYKAVRGFSSDYLFKKVNVTDLSAGVNKDADAGKQSDRLRISSFYAPITTDERHGCTHSFIELENTSEEDIPLDGVYLHFYNPTDNDYQGGVHHLALDGVIPAGGTYLIRGAKHAEFDDASAFIKVRTYDKEWYENGKLLSFEQEKVKTVPSGTSEIIASDAPFKKAYRFCLTYGLPDLASNTILVEQSPSSGPVIGSTTLKIANYPNIIVNPRFIDSCSYSTFASVASKFGPETVDGGNPWYCNGTYTETIKGNPYTTNGVGITIKPNSMFRLMFALDPAKQAFNAFNKTDSSRVRYTSGNDIQILDLNNEFIGFPNSKEIIRIDRYTPKASFEHKNVMTDKSQLNSEKPNMVTCSFGVDVYNTRCFNWISCGTFDESVWIRIKNDSTPNSWKKFDSYKKVSSAVSEGGTKPYKKEYSVDVNNTVYARMINRFPGNDVLFTAHKCVVVLPDVSEPTVYEYVCGRPDKDGKPDFEHTNEIYTFTLYPRAYEGRVYQITDQQGFHWIEYQVWAASAEFLNNKIDAECKAINDEIDEAIEYNTTYAEDIENNIKEARPVHTKVFPILLNTGDMTQSGARINEWLDYYNGGVSLFDHLEQMNCVGNNDLCPINPRELGTGNDNDKSSSHFFHYFYCFDVKDTDKDTTNKFFNGESLIVKAHTGIAEGSEVSTTEDKYIPSLYYFKTKDVLYIIVNSEIPESNVKGWFKLCSTGGKYVNIYTGIEYGTNYKRGNYAGNEGYFTPVYETIYAWLKDNQDDVHSRKVIVAMHEMPFTVITKTSLDNTSKKQLPCTRNHPTAKARLGSNTNQIHIDETRGIYWCSRLLEWFNCKLVIGGHKHTYALSYPIKEKYSWTYTGEEVITGIEKNHIYDSKDMKKPMNPTLADEAGETPTFDVSWDIDITANAVEDESKPEGERRTNKTVYNIKTDGVTLNSTKTPYIPENLYNNYGAGVSSTEDFRCCTPITVTNNDKLDGFVTYSMCQATGYKLKSNKELPSKTQVFSRIIPLTNHADNGDKPNGNQLYPMYSVLEFNDDCSELDVTMNRITGIFQSDNKDSFGQGTYGNRGMNRQVLCTYEKEDCKYWGTNAHMNSLYDEKTNTNITPTTGELYFDTTNGVVNKYDGLNEQELPIWTPVNERMYGKWLSETAAKQRLTAYLTDPTHVSDNRYLHIKF